MDRYVGQKLIIDGEYPLLIVDDVRWDSEGRIVSFHVVNGAWEGRVDYENMTWGAFDLQGVERSRYEFKQGFDVK